MTTITLTKIHSGFANIANTWALGSAHADETRGDFDAEFALPEGYEIARNGLGDRAVYDAAGEHCEVSSDESGAPVLVMARGFVHLNRAEA